MSKNHHYQTSLRWTGNSGKGTESYRAYERSYTVSANGKADIEGSSDPAFRGDPTKYNPEEMLLASLSACHMLWFLHFCSEAAVIVLDYTDAAEGTMTETADGNGKFAEVILHPAVLVQEPLMLEKLNALHDKAHRFCFIANSCNFPILHQPSAAAKSM